MATRELLAKTREKLRRYEESLEDTRKELVAGRFCRQLPGGGTSLSKKLLLSKAEIVIEAIVAVEQQISRLEEELCADAKKEEGPQDPGASKEEGPQAPPALKRLYVEHSSGQEGTYEKEQSNRKKNEEEYEAQRRLQSSGTGGEPKQRGTSQEKSVPTTELCMTLNSR